MANQYTTVQRVWDFIGEENFIADVSWDNVKKCFRIVMRWRDGRDHLTYLAVANPYAHGKNAIWFDSWIGKADYNKQPASFDAAFLDAFTVDVYRSSPHYFMVHILNTYAERYTRPAYFNQDGSTKCKYTQEQLESGRCF